MRRLSRLILIALALLLTAGSFACSKKNAGEESIEFDFSDVSTYGLPLGWTVVSYEEAYEAECSGGVAMIQSEIDDDLRLTRTVPVTGGEKYVLSAEIRTEDVTGGGGASLSIDNFSVDGSYLYSKALYKTTDWTKVELAFETDPAQDSVILALRLGGYSNVSSGTAYFRNVTFERTNTASVSFQRLVPKGTSSDTKQEKTDSEYEGFFSMLFWMTVLSAAVLLFGVYPRRERLENAEMDERRRRILFAEICLAGLVIRLFLCRAFGGHATDMGCWIGWGNQIADGDLGTFYDGTWYDYPPLYMLLLGGMTLFMRLLRVSVWQSVTLQNFWYMLPAFLADIGCAWILMRFAKERNRSDAAALLLAALMVLNPAAVYLSGAWAQIDSILTLLLLLSFRSFQKDRRILCGACYALAILTKWQALIYGPVLALLYIGTIATEKDPGRRGSGTLKTVLAVIVALCIIFAVSFPFRGTMGPLWIVNRFLKASSGYDYATVEGYNFFALLGANWRDAKLDVFDNAGLGTALLTVLNTFGRLMLPISLVFLGAASVKEIKNRSRINAGYALLTVLVLTAFVKIFTYLLPKLENVSWTLYGLAGLMGAAGWFLERYEEKRRSVKETLCSCEEMEELLSTTLLSLTPFVLMLTFWMPLKIFGVSLTFKTFGTVMILLSFAGSVWMLYRYLRMDRMKTDDPEMIYLVSAMFMLWVFTFGQYMHERYVFPVLVLLLFAYAADHNPKILLCALLLSVSTFLNETVAMYVVSDGAIKAIRGGVTHNRFLMACSMIEVITAMYLTQAVIRHLLKKGGEKA